jgi:CheY-like chemotaxis protein
MNRLRILLVEDEAIIAYLLGEVLEGMGHDVCAIESTQAGAIAAALRLKPDLMIVDEHLSEGNGLSVVQDLATTMAIAHVFVSGDALRIRGLMPNAVVLEKPFHEAELARAIRNAMGANAPVCGLDLARPAAPGIASAACVVSEPASWAAPGGIVH